MSDQTPEQIEDLLKKKLYEYRMKYKIPAEKGSTDSLDPAAVRSAHGDILNLVMDMLDAADDFYEKHNGKAGQGYAIVKRVLSKYRDNRWVRKNRSFRFGQPKIAPNVEFAEEFGANGTIDLVARIKDSKNKTVKELSLEEMRREIKKRGYVGEFFETAYTATLTNVYYMTDIANETDWAVKTLYGYLHSYKPGLESILTLMIELIVDAMEGSDRKKLNQYARLIKAVYMNRETEDMSVEEIMHDLGYANKKTYYNHHDAAISLIGRRLFGLEPGEFGLADIVMENGEYIFADQLLYNKVGKRKGKGTSTDKTANPSDDKMDDLQFFVRTKKQEK